MDVLPVHKTPALLMDDTLVIADLHIGIEHAFRTKGYRLSSQTAKLKRAILQLVDRHRPKRLVILGDVKHNIPGISHQELGEIPWLFEALSTHIDVEVVLGNHDGNLRRLIPQAVRVHPKGMWCDTAYLTHGHRKLDDLKCSTLVIAHNHPVVLFVDDMGFRHSEPCWLRLKSDKMAFELIVMPAFNRLCGNPVNVKNSRLLGPLSKMFVLDRADVYLLDGALLGKLSDLRL